MINNQIFDSIANYYGIKSPYIKVLDSDERISRLSKNYEISYQKNFEAKSLISHKFELVTKLSGYVKGSQYIEFDVNIEQFDRHVVQFIYEDLSSKIDVYDGMIRYNLICGTETTMFDIDLNEDELKIFASFEILQVYGNVFDKLERDLIKRVRKNR